MRQSFALLVGVLLAGAASGCAQAAGELSDQDKTAIKAQIDTYVKTVLAADWDGFGSVHTTDAITMAPNGAPINGRAAIMAFGKAIPRVTAFTAPATEVTGRGDLAYAVGTYDFTATLPGGLSSNDKGSYIDVLRRQSDGSWLFSRNIWHSDAPLPDPAAVEKELIALEQTLADATVKNDRAVFERFYADDYVYTHSNGSVLNKAQELAELTDQKWTAVKFADLKVRVIGETAIVTGSETLIGSAKGYVPGPRRITDIFARRNGAWLQIGGQTTLAK